MKRVREDDGTFCFEMAGIVRTKHVFKTRPKPIIHLPEKKTVKRRILAEDAAAPADSETGDSAAAAAAATDSSTAAAPAE